MAVLNAAFCITCSFLMLVDDARGDYVEEEYSRAGLMTALLVTNGRVVNVCAVCELRV